MRKQIPGNPQLSITLSGEIVVEPVVGYNGEQVKFEIRGDQVSLYLNQKWKTVDAAWLRNLAKFEMFMPKGFEDRIFDVYFIEELHPSRTGVYYVTRPWFRKPVDIDPEFRVIPGFTRYAVNRRGSIKEIETNKEVSVYEGKYPSIKVFNPRTDRVFTTSVHRMVALAWVPNENPTLNIEVNHINGDKRDYFYRNLEWTTPSGNIHHAVREGLRDWQTVKGRVFDAVEKTEHHFDTLASACQFMGISVKRAGALTTLRAGKLYNGRYEFRVEGDDRPWFYQKKPLETKVGRYTVTLTDGKGVVTTYYRISDLMNDFPDVPIGNPRAKAVVDKIQKAHPELTLSLVGRSGTNPVQAKNLETDEVLEAPNPTQLAKRMGVHYAEVQRYINEGIIDRPCKGWLVRKQTDQPWMDNDQIKPGRTTAKPIKAVSIDDGSELTFRTLSETMAYFGLSDSTIRDRLASGKPLARYNLSYA